MFKVPGSESEPPEVDEFERPRMPDKKKWARFSGLAIVLVIAGIIGTTSFFTVTEHERAVVTSFGKTDPNRVYGAGLHFKVPFVQNYQKVDMRTIGMELGYKSENNTVVALGEESVMITKDFNFVVVDFYIEWRVSDPIKYIYSADSPQRLLSNIVQSSARSVVSGYDVDEVLTTAKEEIQNRVKELVSEKLLEYDLGIVISNITIQDAEPPTEEIITAFKDVENAKQQKETEINKANEYANTKIPFARSEADRLRQEAESVRASRVLEATGQVARFNALFTEYNVNSAITRTRMYLEAMEEVLPGVKVVVESSGDTLKLLDLTRNGGVTE